MDHKPPPQDQTFDDDDTYEDPYTERLSGREYIEQLNRQFGIGYTLRGGTVPPVPQHRILRIGEKKYVH
jgi:hypothetical protein